MSLAALTDGLTGGGMMGYQIRIVPEVEAWLTELRQGDPATAAVVDEAVEALRIAGESLGPPMVIPLDESPRAADPRQALDHSHQRMLENLTRARRGVAAAATSRKRVELHVEQLERRAAALAADPSPDAARTRAEEAGQLDDLRTRRAHLEEEEQRLAATAMRMQRELDAFRIRKESVRVALTAADAARRTERTMAAAGAESELAHAELDWAEEASAVRTRRPEPGADGGLAEGPEAGQGEPAPGARDPARSLELPVRSLELSGQRLELYELRPGASGVIGARILFTVEAAGPETMQSGVSAGAAVLLAAGTEEDRLVSWYRDAMLLCRSRYRRPQSPSAGTPG